MGHKMATDKIKLLRSNKNATCNHTKNCINIPTRLEERQMNEYKTLLKYEFVGHTR